MTELQERLERLQLLSRLDETIRFLRRVGDDVARWPLADRHWFAKVLEPVPPTGPVEVRLAASDNEITERAAILGALLQQFKEPPELEKQVDTIAMVWGKLSRDEELSPGDGKMVVDIAVMIRRYLLKNAPREDLRGLGIRRLCA